MDHSNPAMLALIASGLLVAVLSRPCQQQALSTWDTACKWGGLVVRKGEHEVSGVKCDAIYPKEDWQPPQPEIVYPAAEKDKIYTVFVIDPDAPDHPAGSYYLHMLQANIQGSDLMKGDFSQAISIASYVGPAPPEGTGLHRYMFVVYRNEPNFMVEKMDTPERWLFNLTKWLEENGKGLVGPEAGVQFQAGYSFN